MQLGEGRMTDAFWIEDAQIAILADSPVEAADFAEMAKDAKLGRSVMLRKPSALAALLESGELQPRVVVLSRGLGTEAARTCVSACKSANAAIILVDNATNADLVEPPFRLLRPFTIEQLKSAFRNAGFVGV